MHRIELQQVSRRCSVASGIIDMHQLDPRPAPESPEHQAANPSKTIDADAHADPNHPSNYVDPSRSGGAALVIQNTLNVEQSRQLLKALADPIRLDVIHALAQGERCVCDLTGDLNLSQSKLSFHLRVLREAGLLTDRQSGRWIYYRLQPDALAALETWLAELRRHCMRKALPPAQADDGSTAFFPGNGTQSRPHRRPAEPAVACLRGRAGTGQRQW